jgi:molybdopterin synthase catalytic subunit
VRLDVRLAPEPLSADAELAKFISGLDEEGAVVSFVGIARPRSIDGAPLARLFLDHHPRLTGARFGVSAIGVVHRCGEVLPGAPIVFAAAGARHRRAAFEAADYLMDRLKTDAVFWKREDGVDGSIWVEPRDSDLSDRARWSE